MFPIKDTIPTKTFPIATWTIIALCGIVFYFETTLPDKLLLHLIKTFGIVPSEFTRPFYRTHHRPFVDYVAFITTMFLHGGWLHILGNMWFLHIFGSKIEETVGHLRFLIFYLICGIFASMAYTYISPKSHVPVIGASGAIAGVMGAYYVMFPRARILTFIPIIIIPWFAELPAFIFLGWWFILQVFSGTAAMVLPGDGGGVAWWGHIGGFVAGIILVFFFRQKGRRHYTGLAY